MLKEKPVIVRIQEILYGTTWMNIENWHYYEVHYSCMRILYCILKSIARYNLNYIMFSG